jgi:hypothetical protein
MKKVVICIYKNKISNVYYSGRKLKGKPVVFKHWLKTMKSLVPHPYFIEIKL